MSERRVFIPIPEWPDPRECVHDPADFEKPPRTDDPPGRYVNLSRSRLGLVDPVVACGWPSSECESPAVAVAVKIDPELMMVVDDHALCAHHARWLEAARVLEPDWHVVEVK